MLPSVYHGTLHDTEYRQKGGMSCLQQRGVGLFAFDTHVHIATQQQDKAPSTVMIDFGSYRKLDLRYAMEWKSAAVTSFKQVPYFGFVRTLLWKETCVVRLSPLVLNFPRCVAINQSSRVTPQRISQSKARSRSNTSQTIASRSSPLPATKSKQGWPRQRQRQVWSEVAA